jgi:hypothetical protein
VYVASRIELLARIDWLVQIEGVASDRASVKSALKTWTGGGGSAARKEKLFEDRLIDIASERLSEIHLTFCG